MGYDFVSDSGATWGTGSMGWRIIRQLARRHGWVPAGTVPEEGSRDGAGEYTGNNGQRVTPEDARALAVALRAALASPGFGLALAELQHGLASELAAASTATVRLELQTSPADEWRPVLTDFAAFCERGGFSIG